MASCTNTTVRFQLRRATESQWISANPILLLGEPAYSTDTNQIKIGDGNTNWSALSYINVAGISGATGGVGTQTTQQATVFLSAASKSGTTITLSATPTSTISPGTPVAFTTSVSDNGSPQHNILPNYTYYVVSYSAGGPGTVSVSKSATLSPAW